MRIKSGILAGLAIAIMTISAAHAADTNAAAFSDAQKIEMQKIIKDYISDHPEIIFESVQRFQEKQQADAAAETAKKIPEYKEFLTAAGNPSIGPKNAKVTIVEFFDFNCGYCKHAFQDIAKLSKQHPDVRFVFKELPILSPTSKTAAQWALAAHRQGKYFEYHSALMDHKGAFDDASLEKIAKDLNLDIPKMKKDVADPAIGTEIEKNLRVADELGIHGTPGFIVNGKSYPGYLGEEGMEQAIRDAAASAK